MKRLPTPAKVLPPDAVELLQKACCTPIRTADPQARVKAINHAIEQIKYRYPQLFQQEL